MNDATERPSSGEDYMLRDYEHLKRLFTPGNVCSGSVRVAIRRTYLLRFKETEITRSL